MKKTFNINIGGFVFTIDDDAYSLLNDYIDTLQNAFRTQADGKEIVDDIESRIAELFQEKIAGGQLVITLADTEEIINRIGQPEDILSVNEISVESSDADNDETAYSETISMDDENHTADRPYQTEKINKKLFRDPQNGMLGGVCAGLAEYLNVDTSLIRILVLISVFISLSITAFVYVLLWIILPEARTPYDRMQMKGEKPTIENIGKKVTDSFRNASDNIQENMKNNRTGFWGGLMKVLIVIFLVIAFPVIFALGIAFISCLFALLIFIVATIAGGSHLISEFMFGDTDFKIVIYGLLTAIGFIIVIGVPIYALIRMSMRNRGGISSGWKWSLVITWIIGFILAGVFTGLLIKRSADFDGHKFIRSINEGIYEIESSDNSVTSSESGIYEIPTDDSETDTITVTDTNVTVKAVK